MDWQRALRALYRLARRSLRQARQTIPLVAIAVGLFALSVYAIPTFSEQLPSRPTTVDQTAQKPAPDFPLEPHPLPTTLAQWHGSTDDYFDQVKPVPVNYLVWTHFPVAVYIQPATPAELANPSGARRSQAWITAVTQAVQEWNPYLPLQLVPEQDGADITVWRSPPPLQLEDNPTTAKENASGQTLREPHPLLQTGRVRSAVTRYQIYAQGLSKDAATPSRPMLAQRFTIQLRPDQAPQYLQAAARHELGHALGIWGHSQSQADVMYFAQVRQPPPLSTRDINTLKRVYEQPTRLGWALSG